MRNSSARGSHVTQAGDIGAPSAENVDLLSSRRTSPLVFDRIRLPQFRDQPQEVGKQISRDGDLGHLKCDVAAMADELRADFDELLFQGRQRPVLTWGGPGQGVRFSRA